MGQVAQIKMGGPVGFGSLRKEVISLQPPGWATAFIVVLTGIIALVLLADTVLTDSDIPAAWASLIGLVWAAVFGLRDILQKGKDGDKDGD